MADIALSSTSSLSALIIGINKYKDRRIPTLDGAVNDARDMREYVKVDLGVPNELIIYLEDDQANRQGIIDAFKRLETLPNLPNERPVLIYFAGHGTKVALAGGDVEMEAIIPYDCTFGAAVEPVHPILDKTINSLIESLSNKIGNNITVISDCCFSASITRGLSDDHHVRRWVFPEDYHYPVEIDANIVFGSPSLNLSTHVLLAACSESEVARESRLHDAYHGDFTRALLALLKSMPINRLTPADVMFLLKPDQFRQQSPQCRGENRLRHFFDGKAPTYQWYRVTHDRVANEYRVNAGVLHGLAQGARFKIFSSRNIDDYLGIEEVESVQTSFSQLIPDQFDEWSDSDDLHGQEWFAILHDHGAIEQSKYPRVLVKESVSNHISHTLRNIVMRPKLLPGDSNISSFGVTESDGQIFLYNRHRYLILPNGEPDELPHRITHDPDQLRKICTHAALFFYHLDNGNWAPSPENLDFEIKQIGENVNQDGRLQFQRLRPQGHNLLVGGSVEINRPGTGVYTATVKNSSSSDWYVTLLFFDGTQQTISQLYGPGCSGQFKTDPCLPKHGYPLELRFGENQRKQRGMTFSIPSAERQRDFGVLKFIFTSKAISFKNICSTSSLDSLSQSRAISLVDVPDFDEDCKWGVHYIPVVITKPKPIN